ncbi:MAG TPA: IS200/IS605 family transposase [Acidobacteriota bacterium]|nr:IS200/IS605 family transposase [Acidobacteriota bacterium]
MSSTHFSLYYHIVFSTKHRQPLISQDWRPRLHAFLGGAIRTLGGVAETVGGTADHAHLLITLRTTHRLADVMRDLKHSSSQWVHETLHIRNFGWQDGYGVFTVSPTNIDKVKSYIQNQEGHHQQRTFREEYLNLLKMSGVEFDESLIE